MIPTEYYRTIRRSKYLVCYWRLNDISGIEAIDRAGKYNLNGLYNGSPLSRSALIYPSFNEVESFAPSSKLFGESGQNVEVLDAAPLRIVEDITIESWINIFEENHTGYIFNKMNGIASGANPYELGLSVGKLHFGLGNGSTSVKASYETLLPILTPLHIVATSFRGNMKIFVDGKEVASAVLGKQKVEDAKYQAYIGALPGGGSRFKGLIGEVALYNAGMSQRTAREHFAIGRQIIYNKPYYTTYDPPSY